MCMWMYMLWNCTACHSTTRLIPTQIWLISSGLMIKIYGVLALMLALIHAGRSILRVNDHKLSCWQLNYALHLCVTVNGTCSSSSRFQAVSVDADYSQAVEQQTYWFLCETRSVRNDIFIMPEFFYQTLCICVDWSGQLLLKRLALNFVVMYVCQYEHVLLCLWLHDYDQCFRCKAWCSERHDWGDCLSASVQQTWYGACECHLFDEHLHSERYDDVRAGQPAYFLSHRNKQERAPDVKRAILLRSHEREANSWIRLCRVWVTAHYWTRSCETYQISYTLIVKHATFVCTCMLLITLALFNFLRFLV